MTNKDKTQKIRITPAIVIVSIQWICWLIIPNFLYGAPATATVVFGSLAGGLAVIIWWAFFSRVPRTERLIVLALIAIALFVFPGFADESIRFGMTGLMFYIYAVPSLSFALLAWAIITRITRDSSGRLRLVSLLFAIILANGIWLLVRSNGLSGHAKADFDWRWNVPEDVSQPADIKSNQATAGSADMINAIAEWPGFRGPNRDSRVYNTHIQTDWAVSPPEELWRRPVGAGCSSFAVVGNYLFTQEQIGDYERVTCYNIHNGEPVWIHQDSVRFYDQHAGAGPRSTPTFHKGKLFTLGATGLLNVLDAHNGKLQWSRNTAADTGSKDSGWGFTSSPLVVNDRVIVAATGKLVAYDIQSGKQIWQGPDIGDSYSSAHLLKTKGEEHILLMSGPGLTCVEPDAGKPVWKYDWPVETRILQPALISEEEILINSGQKKGLKLIKITNGSGNWQCNEIWTSRRMRPDFNDFVIHEGYVFGFDGPYLACLDAKTGERKWRGERYGGQLILLADQDLLLVLTEKGELALANADPVKFTELSRMPVLKGKTWNHPVLVNDLLLVRNPKEMAAYRFATASR